MLEVLNTMGLKDALDALSELIAVYESEEMSVQRMETQMTTGDDGVELHATLDLPIALCQPNTDSHPELSPQSVTLTDEGGLQVEFSPSALSEVLPDCGAAISIEKEGVQVSTGGTILLTVAIAIDATAVTANECDITVTNGNDDGIVLTSDSTAEASDANTADVPESSDDDSVANTKLAAELQNVRDNDVPPYDDVPYLQKLYDSCDTFVEMSEWIEMDVAAETVRRYMIDAGVHTPTSYDTTEDGHGRDNEKQSTSTESNATATTPSPSATDDPIEDLPNKELIADGPGLPSDLHMEDIADAVVNSRTIYEVQRQLDLEQQYTRELLRDLNLLELVMGRVNDTSREDVTRKDVADRIRQCGPAEAGGRRVKST